MELAAPSASAVGEAAPSASAVGQAAPGPSVPQLLPPREDPIAMLEEQMRAAKARGKVIAALKKRPCKERDDSQDEQEVPEDGEASPPKTKGDSKPGPPAKKAKGKDAAGPGGPKAAEAVVKDVLSENVGRVGRKGWNKDKLHLKAYNQVKGRLGSKVEGINASGDSFT